MSQARLALVGGAAAAFLIAMAPLRICAQWRGWRVAGWTPRVFHRLACAALGIEVVAHGRPGPSRRLIVANHLSWLDIPVLGSIEPMRFLAKREVGAPPLGGRLARLQGIILVDRAHKRAIPAINAQIAEALATGEPVLLFAEATTGDGNRLLPFRSSHFEAARLAAARPGAGETVVQPVYLVYSRLAGMSAGRRERPIFAWYGDMTFLPHLRRFLRAGHTRCDVYYGAPIAVAEEPGRKPLARRTEAAVRALAQAARATPILAPAGLA